MKLITETVEQLEYIKESTENGSKNYFIEGIIMQGDIKNRNGRVYPKSTLMREMARYSDNYVKQNRAYGELGHPQGPTINLDRVSHMFTKLSEDGSNVVGKAKIMDTPMGKIVKNLIDEGANLGISSRGLGTLKKNSQGIMEVQDDFMLATAGDIVADPSAPNAFVRGIMEGSDWAFDIGSQSWVQISEVEKLVEEVKTTGHISKRQLEENAAEYFKQYLKIATKNKKI